MYSLLSFIQFSIIIFYSSSTPIVWTCSPLDFYPTFTISATSYLLSLLAKLVQSTPQYLYSISLLIPDYLLISPLSMDRVFIADISRMCFYHSQEHHILQLKNYFRLIYYISHPLPSSPVTTIPLSSNNYSNLL